MAHGLLVKFFIDAVHMTHRSKMENRPIFEDREFIEIIPIGDNKTCSRREATDDDRKRFPDEYGRFKAGRQEKHSGTPLEEWPYMKPSQIRTLNALNIFTVEHLAEVGDDGIQRIGQGAREWRKQAEAYLAKAKDGAGVNMLAVENEQMKERIAELEKSLAALASQQQSAGNRQGGNKAAA